jgi:hypothetical protein
MQTQKAKIMHPKPSLNICPYMPSDRYGSDASPRTTLGSQHPATSTLEKTIMRRLTLILLAVLGCSLLSNSSHAQVANTCPVPPATKLESFDTNVSTIVIKGTTETGSLSANTGVVSVRCREITLASSGHKEQGIALEITQKDQTRDTLLIDYDEISSLLDAIDYLNKLDFSVTSLNFFDATFTTKGGFRIAAFGRQRTGAIQFAVRDARTNLAPIIFTRDEMARFGGLIEQAKRKLDSLRGG